MAADSTLPKDSAEREMPVPNRDLRASGMRDLGPEEMERFRHVERVFLDVSARHDYQEIRTPTLEPCICSPPPERWRHSCWTASIRF